MQLPQIINSLLENDMYKFSMGQCIYHQFSAYKTTWTTYAPEQFDGEGLVVRRGKKNFKRVVMSK